MIQMVVAWMASWIDLEIKLVVEYALTVSSFLLQALHFIMCQMVIYCFRM